eukprot:7575521-Alexandrium_andersonii.AAC.1
MAGQCCARPSEGSILYAVVFYRAHSRALAVYLCQLSFLSVPASGQAPLGLARSWLGYAVPSPGEAEAGLSTTHVANSISLVTRKTKLAMGPRH